jgi:hypothetical protein
MLPNKSALLLMSHLELAKLELFQDLELDPVEVTSVVLDALMECVKLSCT